MAPEAKTRDAQDDTMDATPNLSLPFLMAAQAQKHVTHNEALRALDAVVQLAVADKDLATPPGAPAEGACYLVAAGPTGAWSGQSGKVAAFQDGAWAFYAPRTGWLAWVADEATLYVWNGTAWAIFAGGDGGSLANVVEDATPQLGGDLDANGHGIGFDDGTGLTDDAGNAQLILHKTASAVNCVGVTNAATGSAPQIAAEGGESNIDLTLAGKGTGHPKAALFGVNATADATTKFAVAAAASLFNHAGAGHQHKINKAAAGDTASLLFQTGTSGRAEMGTAGDDDFHVKVSADGATWKEALVVDRASGAVSLPLTPRREILTANRTYYVRTDGSDANTGLANTSGGAFLTIQKAIDTVAGLDLSVYDALIQVGAGTYTSQVALKTIVGAGLVTLRGDTSTPANVVISTTGADCILGNFIQARYHIEGFRLTAATAGRGIFGLGGALNITFGSLEFASVPSGYYQIAAGQGCSIVANANYAIVGGAGSGMHIFCSNAHVSIAGRTVTLTGTPPFGEFVRAIFLGLVEAQSATFSGSATGARYNAFGNAVIYTNSGGATHFPGNASGAASSGGQYL